MHIGIGERNLQCKICKKASPFRCAFCGSVTYCGSRCQRRDWNTHRPSCRREFIAVGADGKEYKIDVAPFQKVSEVCALIEASVSGSYGSNSYRPTDGKEVLIQEPILGDWSDCRMMKDLFNVSHTPTITFTWQTPRQMPCLVSSSDSDDQMPCLVSSSDSDDLPRSLAVASDVSSDESSDDSE